MTYQEKQLQLFEYLEQQFREGKTPVTLVPSMTDYAHDHRLCLTSVVFIPDVLQQHIQKNIIEPLQRADPSQYYYVPHSFHLTIQNIRTIADPPQFTHEDIIKVQNSFGEIIAQQKAFSVKLNRLFELPTSISLCGFSDAVLGDLVSALRKNLLAIGIPDDKTYVSQEVMFGNISICRYVHTPNQEFFETVKKLKQVTIGTLEVKTISLITTNAVCRPEKTTIIQEFPIT